MVPQPKPPRQPPEVKPKPQICPPVPPAASTSATASAQMEEDEEEDNKFMKELQVCSTRYRSVKVNLLVPGLTGQLRWPAIAPQWGPPLM